MTPITVNRGPGVCVVIDSLESVTGAQSELIAAAYRYTIEVSGLGGIAVDAATFAVVAAELAKRGAK
jgi:hypothetical protein